jgi:hypothetical protein
MQRHKIELIGFRYPNVPCFVYFIDYGIELAIVVCYIHYPLALCAENILPLVAMQGYGSSEHKKSVAYSLQLA